MIVHAPPRSRPGARTSPRRRVVVHKEKRIRPLHDRILVEPAELKRAFGGVIIPDNQQDRPAEGIVKRIGTGKTLDDGTKLPIDVEVGDIVVYGRYSGQDVTIENVDYKLMREDEILGVYELADVPDDEDLDVPDLYPVP